MAEFAPQYNLFKIVNRLSSIGQFTFWLVLILSISPVLFKEFCDKYTLLHFINIVNIIGISIYFILDIINNYILKPQADSKRRDDFIDNSFGSLFSASSSVGYYDNDEINKGVYKVAVNLFENCFFSYSLVRAITTRKIIIPSIILLVMIIISYYGFSQVPFALTILQALFSANILGLLVKHLILINRLSTIQDSWVSLFQNEDIKEQPMKYQSSIFRYWLQYETLQSKINIGIPDTFFKKHNPVLTREWEELKTKFNIS